MAAVAVMATSSGYFVAGLLNPVSEPVPVVSGAADGDIMSAPRTENLLGQRRPDFTLMDADGQEVSASDFDGQPVLINFWATWCAPCVEEMPMLSSLQEQYSATGIRFLGIALDDADRAREFAAEMNLGYPILVGQVDVVLTGRRYGNSSGMLPFSVLVDADGIIRWTHLGALDREQLENKLIDFN